MVSVTVSSCSVLKALTKPMIYLWFNCRLVISSFSLSMPYPIGSIVYWIISLLVLMIQYCYVIQSFIFSCKKSACIGDLIWFLHNFLQYAIQCAVRLRKPRLKPRWRWITVGRGGYRGNSKNLQGIKKLTCNNKIDKAKIIDRESKIRIEAKNLQGVKKWTRSKKIKWSQKIQKIYKESKNVHVITKWTKVK